MSTASGCDHPRPPTPAQGPLDAKERSSRRDSDALAARGRRGALDPPLAKVIFVSGCAGDTRRYRVFHQAEALWLADWPVRVRLAEKGLDDLDPRPGQILILHRLEWTAETARLIARARAANCPLLFDTDDLVFEPAVAGALPPLAPLPGQPPRPAVEVAASCRRTLEACDGALVATSYLAERVRRLGKPAAVVRNAMSLEQLRLARQARATALPGHGLTVGYASGTPTHEQDFRVAQVALQRLLADHPELQVRLYGYLDLDDTWLPYLDRVERVPFMSWRRLVQAMADLDINLAPLVVGHPFCEAKSELKYFEAGLLGVPTVASPTGAFREAIEHRRTGYLATSPEEWYAYLSELLAERKLRQEVGRAAQADCLARYLTDGRARELIGAIQSLVMDRWAAVDSPGEKLAKRSPEAAGGGLPPTVRPARGRPFAGRSGAVTTGPGQRGPDSSSEPLCCTSLRRRVAGWLAVANEPSLQRPRRLSVLLPPRAHVEARVLAEETLRQVEARVPAVELLRLECPWDLEALGPQQEEALEAFVDQWLGWCRESQAVLLVSPVTSLLTVVLAMAAGAVVVAAPVVGLEWLLQPAVTAAVAAPLASALAAEVLLVMEDKTHQHRLAEGGRLVAERLGRIALVRFLAHQSAAWSEGEGRDRLGPDDNNAVLSLDWLQPLQGREPLTLGPVQSIGQSFVARLDGLCRFDVRFAWLPPAEMAPVEFELRRGLGVGPPLVRVVRRAGELLVDEWEAFVFEPIPASSGQRFLATLSSPAAEPEAGFAVWLSEEDLFTGGRTYLGGRPSRASLTFRTFARAPIGGLSCRGAETGSGQMAVPSASCLGLPAGHGHGSVPATLLPPALVAARLESVQQLAADRQARLAQLAQDRLHRWLQRFPGRRA